MTLLGNWAGLDSSSPEGVCPVAFGVAFMRAVPDGRATPSSILRPEFRLTRPG